MATKEETVIERYKKQIEDLNKEKEELRQANKTLQNKNQRYEAYDLEELLKASKELTVMKEEFNKYKKAYEESFHLNKKLGKSVTEYRAQYLNLLKIIQGTIDTHIFVEDNLRKELEGGNNNG